MTTSHLISPFFKFKSCIRAIQTTLLAATLLQGSNAIALDLNSKEIRSIVEKTAIVERPNKAAELVSLASPEQQTRVAIRVVRLFLVEAHSLAPSLVAAIVQQTPTVASAVVNEAISLFPELAYSITRAAISKAPEQAAQIALRAAIQHGNHAEPILSASLAAHPDVEPFLIAFLEDPATLERTHSESSLVSYSRYFSRYLKNLNARKYKSNRPHKNDNDDDDDDGHRRRRHPEIPTISPEDLPFSDRIEISQLRNHKWLIEIEVPKGKVGNQILRKIRTALKKILKNPHLRHHFRLKIHRYNH